MISSVITLIWFIGGVTLGTASLSPDFLESGKFTSVIVSLLLALVGVGIGANKNTEELLKKVAAKTLLRLFIVTCVVMIGSWSGAALISLYLQDMPIQDVLAASSGFGYYSAPSVLITKIRGDHLGVIALLSNLIREVITLVFAPLLTRLFGKLAPIAAGGATAMDTTLASIIKSSGPEYAFLAVSNGIILTFLAPIFVMFFLGLGKV